MLEFPARAVPLGNVDFISLFLQFFVQVPFSFLFKTGRRMLENPYAKGLHREDRHKNETVFKLAGFTSSCITYDSFTKRFP